MANTTMEALIAELLGDVGKLNTALESVSDVVTDLTQGQTQRLDDAAAALDRAAAEFEHRTKANMPARPPLALPRLLLAGLLVGVIASGVAIVATASMSPRMLLSPTDRAALENGQLMDRAWPQLDAATKAKISAAAR